MQFRCDFQCHCPCLFPQDFDFRLCSRTRHLLCCSHQLLHCLVLQDSWLSHSDGLLACSESNRVLYQDRATTQRQIPHWMPLLHIGLQEEAMALGTNHLRTNHDDKRFGVASAISGPTIAVQWGPWVWSLGFNTFDSTFHVFCVAAAKRRAFFSLQNEPVCCGMTC